MRKRKNVFQGIIKKTLGDPRYQNVTIPLFTILIALIVGAIVLLILGKNPLSAYYNLLQGCGFAPKASYAGHKSILTDFMNFLSYLTPMIFAALAFAVSIRSGLFNIGISGQMLAAGFVASITVGYSSLAAPVAKPLVVLIGVAVGAVMGGIVGFLKYKFNINEVVSTIMLNYILQYVCSFFINTYFVDPVSRQSRVISQASRLTLVDTVVGDLKMDIPLGILLALVAVAVVKFLMDKTKLGYEMKAVGFSGSASKYAGINVGKNIVLTMVISGALAGLAGVTYYMGYFGSIKPRTLCDTGFDAIAVCLLGNCNPVGIIFASILITVIDKGSTYMSSTAGVQAEIADVITGVILLFCACTAYIKYRVARMEDKEEKK